MLGAAACPQAPTGRMHPPKCSLCRADAVVRMLHFNSLPPSGVSRPDEDVYKVLVMDRDTKDVLAPLLHVNVRLSSTAARRRSKAAVGQGGAPPSGRASLTAAMP